MKSIIAVFAVLLAACATYQPELGTTSLSDWQSECKKRSWMSGQLIAAVDNLKAYTCQGAGGISAGTIYVFEDDVLKQITTSTELMALEQQRAQAAGQLGTDLLFLQQLQQLQQ